MFVLLLHTPCNVLLLLGNGKRTYSMLIVPELVIQLLCLLSVRSLYIAIVMEGTAGKVVHVDPNRASPIRGVMLSVIL